MKYRKKVIQAILISIIIISFIFLFAAIFWKRQTIENMEADREYGMKSLLKKCAEKYGEPAIENMDFTDKDRGSDDINEKIYRFCYNKTIPELKQYCGPGFQFHSWQSSNISSFHLSVVDLEEAGASPAKTKKLGWYGNIHSPAEDVPEYHTRPKLKEIGDQNPERMDIINIVPDKGQIAGNAKYKSMTDLTHEYQYLLDIGGNGWSGRLSYLLFSQRPLFVVERKYIEYYTDDLIEYEHYIPVKEDLSDLIQQLDWADAHPDECKKIAKNALDFAKANFSEEKLLERIYKVYNNIQQG